MQQWDIYEFCFDHYLIPWSPREDSSGSWHASVIQPVLMTTLDGKLTRGCMEFLMVPRGYRQPISGINRASLGHCAHPSSRQLVYAHFYFRAAFALLPIQLPWSTSIYFVFYLVPGSRENRAAYDKETSNEPLDRFDIFEVARVSFGNSDRS